MEEILFLGLVFLMAMLYYYCSSGNVYSVEPGGRNCCPYIAKFTDDAQSVAVAGGVIGSHTGIFKITGKPLKYTLPVMLSFISYKLLFM